MPAFLSDRQLENCLSLFLLIRRGPHPNRQNAIRDTRMQSYGARPGDGYVVVDLSPPH